MSRVDPTLILCFFNVDEFVKSQKSPVFVIPANAGIQGNRSLLDSRFRGSDGLGDFLRDHQCLSNPDCGERTITGVYNHLVYVVILTAILLMRKNHEEQALNVRE